MTEERITDETYYTLLNSRFGEDTSDGQTCDCHFCQAREIAKQDHEIVNSLEKIQLPFNTLIELLKSMPIEQTMWMLVIVELKELQKIMENKK